MATPSISPSNENRINTNYQNEDVNLNIDEVKIEYNRSESSLTNKLKILIENAKKDINKTIPVLSEPEIKKPNIKILLDELDVNLPIDKNKIIKNTGQFNFISDEMMNLINLIVKYLEAMIKKFEASRELGATLMTVELNMADQMKDNLNKKASIMLTAAISSAAVSMTIHGLGAFTSIKGMGKELIGHSNPMMVKGTLITATADPLARIADQSLQINAIKIDGKQKVLEARSSTTNHVINNNNELQREVAEIIKALLQAIEAIIHANQDAASSIGSNVRG
ncbi:type III secretion protein [Proteus vulgaris]|uniref:Type III secretion protein n=1 Tax=Proteus vulgaris TaxID=585 RepID=A0A6G6SRF1_PROVU|nr:type III secretion protein [Proteus vulgaris]QIF95629.1 type III secretion protein [Proteus vulgaris]WIF71911.1 type III secretion protein [Proteus vulgaris]